MTYQKNQWYTMVLIDLLCLFYTVAWLLLPYGSGGDWRTYGTRARSGTHSPLCGHTHRRSNTEFVTRKIAGNRARLLPRSGQPPEMTLLRHRGLVTLAVLNQEHPLSLHVISEIIPFVIFLLVIALFLVTLFWFRCQIICVSKNEE